MEFGVQNNLTATISDIKKGDVMCQVKLKLEGGGQMCSVMTMDSLNQLGLGQGDQVKVLVKAVNVVVAK